jgi:Tfp pilus assembly protein PilX
MQLIRRLRNDESGAALVTALLCTMVMLALGFALLAIVDTQANESTDEATRDRGFNLAESVLTNEAFVLGRNWPKSGFGNCFSADSFGDTLGATAPPADSRTLRLRPSLNAAYTDAAYEGATWQVNICDDDAGSTVWDDTLTNNHSYDHNANSMVWVRSQATVAGKTRALVGLVKVRETSAMNKKYGLVTGNVAEDLGPTTSAITGNNVVTTLTDRLLTTNPPVAADPDVPPPGSGVTGLRCGLLDNADQVKTCVTGAIGAASVVPAVNTLVTNGRFEQFPTRTSTSPVAIGQMRKEAIDDATYMPTAPGAGTVADAPSCGISYASDPTKVVFIEKVGTGDQYCYLDVSSSKRWKALVIGSGRIIIRGSNAITPYTTTTSNRLTAVVYALNLQSDHAVASPQIDVVRIEKGARVVGAVHADGKNAAVRIVNPDFDSNALINQVLCDDAVTCLLAPAVVDLLSTAGLSDTLDALINGRCLAYSVDLLGVKVCTSLLPAQGLNEVVGGITTQLTTYGSAINADTDVINALTVYSSSGVMPGTFRDLQVR